VIEPCSHRACSACPAPRELKDPKTRLQEALQARSLGLPSTSVEAVTGGSATHNVFKFVARWPL